MAEQKILVIEDDPSTQVKLLDILQPQGFQVMLAGTETVGLWMLDEQLPQLVVSGIKVSSIRKCYVVNSICEHAAMLSIPMIFLISHQSEIDKIYGCCKLFVDISTCISKPFTEQTLMTVVQKVITN